MGQPPVHEAWLLQYLLVEELYSKMKRKNKQTKQNKKKTQKKRILFYTSLCSLNMYFSFKFLPLILLFQRLCIFSFFFLTVVKKKNAFPCLYVRA